MLNHMEALMAKKPKNWKIHVSQEIIDRAIREGKPGTWIIEEAVRQCVPGSHDVEVDKEMGTISFAVDDEVYSIRQ
jgi:hypothetical protein